MSTNLAACHPPTIGQEAEPRHVVREDGPGEGLDGRQLPEAALGPVRRRLYPAALYFA